MPRDPQSLVPPGGAYDTVQALGLGDPSAWLSDNDPSSFREDGTKKGQGFLGVFRLPGGGVASEYSIADSEVLKDPQGHYRDYPALVPTLTPQELQQTVHAIQTHAEVPDAVKQKAEAFALQRQAAGQPLFATARESPLRVGDTLIPQPPMAVSHEPSIRDLIAERFPQFAQALDRLTR